MGVTHIPHNPQALAQGYLGPRVPIGITRKCISFSSGCAPSYIPTCLFFAHKPPDRDLALQGLNLGTPVEQLVAKPPITPELLLDLCEDFKNHMEGRIQLFLQQMLFLYQTAIPIDSYKHADFQVGQVPSMGNNEPAYVAAHDGTLATLRVAQSVFSDNSISLGQGTSFYHAWNATTYIPLVANQVDSAIDNSLRQQAIFLLNQLSAGTLAPREGLFSFLTALHQIIDSMKKGADSEERRIVLENYHSVVVSYYATLNSEQPLIQRLCLKPLEEVIDHPFYMRVQAEMHAQFQSELQGPQAAVMPQLPADIDLRHLESEVAQLAAIPPKQAREYVTLCTMNNAVHAAAMHYFISLHHLPPEKRSVDLQRVEEVKSLATLERIGLSSAGLNLCNAAFEALSERTTRPNDMGLILLSVLIAVSRDLISKQPAPLQISADSMQLLRSQLEARTPKTTSPAANDYIELCARAEHVHKVAKRFFDELAYVSNDLRQLEINRLFLVTPATRGSAGLSPLALAFYGTVLETIQNSPGGKSNPRNMPFILCRVLLGVSEHEP